MRKIIPVLLIFMVIALSGCIGSNSPGEDDQVGTLTFERENLNLDATIVDVKLAPTDVRAGEKVTAKLVIANSGTDDIVNETIEIRAKVKSLDDIFANLALKVMSDDAKTRTFTMGFNENVKPGTIKPISAVFHTQQELQGRSLAGTYAVTVILSVNGQKVAAKVLPITLRQGKPRDNASDSNPNATPAPAVAVTAGPTTTMTPQITVTPTPVPTPEEITVAPKSPANILVTNIMGYKFGELTKTIEAGDTLQWKNTDEDTMTLVERNGKIPNQTVSWRTNYVFTTTGTYVFDLYYPRMRTPYPSPQTIIVKLNRTS